MLSRFAIAAAATIVLTGPSGAAQPLSPFAFWSGGALIDTVTAACENGGFISARDFVISNYRAKTGVAGEPNSPGITFNLPRSVLAFFRNGGTANANTMHGAGTYVGYLIRGNVTTIPNPNQTAYTGTFNFKVTPAAVTKTTQTVSIDGTITNWRNVAGCTVKFRAAYRWTR